MRWINLSKRIERAVWRAAARRPPQEVYSADRLSAGGPVASARGADWTPDPSLPNPAIQTARTPPTFTRSPQGPFRTTFSPPRARYG